MTTEELQEALNRFDKGLLYRGSHNPDSKEFCALEFDSIVRGRKWSDKPITLPDIRPINDAFTDNKVRTEFLLPVMAALWDWSFWSNEKKQRWITKVVIRTVQEIISELPKLSENIRYQCRNCNSLDEARAAANAARAAATYVDAAAATYFDAAAANAARAAARAAAYATAHAATYAAANAAHAADAAAHAAHAADANKILIQVCKIWIESVGE